MEAYWAGVKSTIVLIIWMLFLAIPDKVGAHIGLVIGAAIKAARAMQ